MTTIASKSSASDETTARSLEHDGMTSAPLRCKRYPGKAGKADPGNRSAGLSTGVRF